MYKVLLLMCALLLSLCGATAFAQDVYVNGYERQDGTYVQPHYRTAPDNTTYNNYSSTGNLNPNTGGGVQMQNSLGGGNPYSNSRENSNSGSLLLNNGNNNKGMIR